MKNGTQENKNTRKQSAEHSIQRITHSPSETKKYVSQLAKQLKGGDIVGLIGPLGAGKTFIVQCLAKILGIKKRPRSPSFTLIQPYSLPKPVRGIHTLIHADAYRVTAAQLLDAGLKDYLNSPHNLIVIEWADRLLSAVPLSYTWRVAYGAKTTDRKINIERSTTLRDSNVDPSTAPHFVRRSLP